ncbi:MAG: hypothetical protein HFJ06_00920 [Lachnospiraceae bacterium]|nr:hypothetical protein [Lachnospiraceae bacterium]
MKKLTKRDKQTAHFLKWITCYPGWWDMICTPNDEYMDRSMMHLLIKRLEQERLYEMIFVLLNVHRNASFMEGFFDYMSYNIIAENLSGSLKNREQVIKDILKFFD